MPEWGPLGSVRGALSNERPYRDLRNVAANYPFERSHRFAGTQPNSGDRDYSRLSCGVAETQLGSPAQKAVPFLGRRPSILNSLGSLQRPGRSCHVMQEQRGSNEA